MSSPFTEIVPVLFEAAIRSACLGIAVWLMLRLLRIQRPQTTSLVWSFVLCSAAVMPLLLTAAKALLENAPRAAAWIPAAPTTVFLRPLAPIQPEVFLLPDVAAVVLLIYAVVAGIELLRLSIGLIRGLLLRSGAVSMREPWAEGLDVRIAENLTVPVTFGRTVLLPKEALEWDEARKRMVLIHEQAHVRRLDFFVQILARIHRAIFWFSPFAWWLQAELARSAEDSCDDEALRHVSDRISYAEILVEMAGKGAKQDLAEVCMARKTTVTRRIERILKQDSIGPQISWPKRMMTVAGIVPLVVLSAGMHAQVEKPPLNPISWSVQIVEARIATAPALAARQTAAPAPQQAPRTESTKIPEGWIDQEVPDISTSAEQTGFKALKTDGEREEFIRQFWLRRDPTPGNAENEYRTEYYSRVAIADQRYGTAGNQGHRTDRGRIFVKFGPPSEYRILAQGNTFPVELWRYPFIEGIGNNVQLEFVDAAGTGDFRLSLDPNQRLLSPLQ